MYLDSQLNSYARRLVSQMFQALVLQASEILQKCLGKSPTHLAFIEKYINPNQLHMMYNMQGITFSV